MDIPLALTSRVASIELPLGLTQAEVALLLEVLPAYIKVVQAGR